MKEKLEDLKYELASLKEVLVKYRYDFPEDTYKILFDLLYHSINTLKELEVLIHDEERVKAGINR